MSTNKSSIAKFTAADVEDMFTSDTDRIKAMSKAYADKSIAETFSMFYSTKLPSVMKKSDDINKITVIEVGNIYQGTVSSISSSGIYFTIPGVKEEIVCKENFNDCRDSFDNYLMNHNNQLLFEVREKKGDRYIVSITNAYYRGWQQLIERAIAHETPIPVHIKELVNGGYVCSTPIWTINELTGKNYTSSVFIPGSHIVLNIESDFNKWIDKDVNIIPQKFVRYRSVGAPAENSLVGSRKRVLQLEGFKNIYDIYTKMQLANKPGVTYTPEKFEGTVTGIINSAKKTGVFIELDGKYITGLMPVSSSELTDYLPGTKVTVTIKEWETQPDKEPFFFDKKNNNQIRKCHIRPVFTKA